MITHLKYERDKIIAVAIIAMALMIVVIGTVVVYTKKHSNSNMVITVPSNWSKDYVESQSDYDTYVAKVVDWSTVEPEPDQVVSYSADDNGTSFEVIASVPKSSITDDDISIINLSENDAWSLISNGEFTSYPTGSFASNKSKLVKIQQTNTETITVDCWYWEDPNDPNNFNKVTVKKTFAVNTAVADLFRHAFADIYAHPSQPIINIGDKGMGTWVLRGKSHNPNRSLSSHSLGVTIDINPSSGSFNVNGTWYGNAYGQKAMPYFIWNSLPETHAKYHVLYVGCPIVEIFKSYGFYWGGDWKSGTDCMHIGFIGDGNTCRAIGKSNYESRK